MTGAEVLRKAADLIEPPSAWTQGAFARTKGGAIIGPYEQNARCWCAHGAIKRVSEHEGGELAAWSARTELVRSIPAWNDHPERTQAEVVTALRQAADLAEAQS